MHKIPTLFVQDPDAPRIVTAIQSPECAWVFRGEEFPTVKIDGTNVRVTVKAGALAMLEKRQSAKALHLATGTEPGYLIAREADPADQHLFAAAKATDFSDWPDGAHPCEAVGPKIQGGVEADVPALYPFLLRPRRIIDPLFPALPTFDSLRAYLEHADIEGVVWHWADGAEGWPRAHAPMAKVKRRDFGFPWPAGPANERAKLWRVPVERDALMDRAEVYRTRVRRRYRRAARLMMKNMVREITGLAVALMLASEGVQAMLESLRNKRPKGPTRRMVERRAALSDRTGGTK